MTYRKNIAEISAKISWQAENSESEMKGSRHRNIETEIMKNGEMKNETSAKT